MPGFCIAIPEYLWVAEILDVLRGFKDWVTLIFRPSAALVSAVRQALGLASRLRVMREDCDHGFFAKPSSIVPVNDGTAREDHSVLIGSECNRQMLPVDEVTADRVSPVD